VWSAVSCWRRSQLALAQSLLSAGWSLAATEMPQQRQYFFFEPGGDGAWVGASEALHTKAQVLRVEVSVTWVSRQARRWQRGEERAGRRVALHLERALEQLEVCRFVSVVPRPRNAVGVGRNTQPMLECH
jgi:hypothetical protein